MLMTTIPSGPETTKRPHIHLSMSALVPPLWIKHIWCTSTIHFPRWKPKICKLDHHSASFFLQFIQSNDWDWRTRIFEGGASGLATLLCQDVLMIRGVVRQGQPFSSCLPAKIRGCWAECLLIQMRDESVWMETSILVRAWGWATTWCGNSTM